MRLPAPLFDEMGVSVWIRPCMRQWPVPHMPGDIVGMYASSSAAFGEHAKICLYRKHR